MRIWLRAKRLTENHPKIHVPLLKVVTKMRLPNRRLPSAKIVYDDGWKVIEDQKIFAVPAPQRGYSIVGGGIMQAKETLAKRYFPAGDIQRRCAGRTVIDVGANIGIFTMAALDAGAERVIAFEPDPLAFACLRANVGNDPRVSIHQVMLNDEDGTSSLFLATSRGDSSMIAPASFQDIIPVISRRLDSLDFVLSDGDVLKVEAEGAEPEVLRGCLWTLSHSRIFVTTRASYERQGESTYADCNQILETIGYRCWAGDNLVPPKQLLAEASS